MANKRSAAKREQTTRVIGYPAYAYVGCFTAGSAHHDYAHGEGISVFRIDPKTGAWKLLQICKEAAPNPGWLALSDDQRYLYACHGSAAEVSSYAVNRETGTLTPLNRQPNHGSNAVHLALDPTNRFVITAQGPGLEVFPINDDGSLAPTSDVIVPPPRDGRQHLMFKAHPHHAAFDPSGRFVVAPDHGIDVVHVFSLDTATGKLLPSQLPAIKSQPGAAPRHVVFHPRRPFAYIINELHNTVTAYKWNSKRGELTAIQVISRTPETYTSKDVGSEIAMTPSGRFLYASNRGHDSVVLYAVNQKTGLLKILGWEHTRGRLPRYFGLNRAGTLLFAANVKTDTIVVFKVNGRTGKLSATGQKIKTASPTCIAFAYA